MQKFAIQERERLRKEAEAAAKRVQALEDQLARRIERETRQSAATVRRLRRIKAHPSPQTVHQLQKLVASPYTPATEKAEAAELILKWAMK